MTTFDQMIERGHEHVCYHQDPDSGLRAIIAVHSTVLGPGFGGAQLVTVPAVAPVDIPVDLGPWRWQPLLVPEHPRGGRVGVRGEGAVEQPWAVARRPLATLASFKTRL